jgi:hypothetical protein
MPDGSIRIVAVNPDARRSWRVAVDGHRGPATVLRLTGPALGATEGIRFGGRQVAADGNFSLPAGESTTDVVIGPASAALITMRPG